MPQHLTPCIVMNGNAREAIHFYEKVLEAKVLHVQSYGEMPIPCPDSLKERVSNALLRIEESELMLFDAPNQHSANGVTVNDKEEAPVLDSTYQAVVALNILIRDVEKTRRIFEALQDGGKVIAPLETVPFSPAFGTVTDKFGVTFILVTQQPN
ncbi:VOC family protein [Brevibacillus fluminis]|uniref:VOC family protein n=1 Tax=Brevibacillus fluminis TaxID=511487 RepID=A0A3M8DXK0_9BACL|nr:VOC family protein [Brevibacillus fluminis]RNB92842.1 VOC family protein [Brevibacillus fluminis]